MSATEMVLGKRFESAVIAGGVPVDFTVVSVDPENDLASVHVIGRGESPARTNGRRGAVRLSKLVAGIREGILVEAMAAPFVLPRQFVLTSERGRQVKR